DVGFTNRPAAIRNPLARFEVDLIKWPTVTAPMIGCAAEAPQARGLQWKVAQPNILADVQRLGGIIGSDVTALQHAYAKWAAAERARERDSSRSRANNTNICC